MISICLLVALLSIWYLLGIDYRHQRPCYIMVTSDLDKCSRGRERMLVIALCASRLSSAKFDVAMQDCAYYDKI